MFRPAIALTGLVIALAAVGSSAAASPAVEINAPGLWSLPRLSAHKIVFSTDRRLERSSIPFSLPSGASQGPKRWYLMKLHFTIEFAKASKPGFVFVSGLTNGRAAAQIEFYVQRSAPGGRVVRWRTLDYIRGGRSGTTKNRRVEIRFENYLQFRGVRSGRNVLTIQLERYDGVEVESLTVHPDSGIVLTQTGPARLRIDVEPSSKRVSVGDEFVLRYTVKNVGQRPALRVSVSPEVRPGIEQLGARVHSKAVLRDSMRGSFRFRALEAGGFPVGIFVDSGTNHPGTLVEIRVSPAGTAIATITGLAPRVVGVLLLIAGLLVSRPVLRRSRRVSGE